MSRRFLDKYRVDTTRAQWWDYSSAGAYFITINTKHRKHCFGSIENGRMILSPCGVLADEFWRLIPERSEFAAIGPHVVMPNHVHGILHILEGAVPRQRIEGNTMSEISPQANSVGAIIRSYKSSVSRRAHKLGLDFAWQPRFHDRIIRNDIAYHNIARYIERNVARWRRR